MGIITMQFNNTKLHLCTLVITLNDLPTDQKCSINTVIQEIGKLLATFIIGFVTSYLSFKGILHILNICSHCEETD